MWFDLSQKQYTVPSSIGVTVETAFQIRALMYWTFLFIAASLIASVNRSRPSRDQKRVSKKDQQLLTSQCEVTNKTRKCFFMFSYFGCIERSAQNWIFKNQDAWHGLNGFCLLQCQHYHVSINGSLKAGCYKCTIINYLLVTHIQIDRIHAILVEN